jgi:hypothetical protein
VVAIVGALIAAAGTGVLVSRCVRAPNVPLITWALAAFALTVALGAQALGYDIGFGPIAFRAMEIGAQILAPLALVLGAAEVAGKTVTSRFAARLLLSALTVVALSCSPPTRSAPRRSARRGRRRRFTTRLSPTSCSSTCWPRPP